jgi:hypothetical protein
VLLIDMVTERHRSVVYVAVVGFDVHFEVSSSWRIPEGLTVLGHQQDIMFGATCSLRAGKRVHLCLVDTFREAGSMELQQSSPWRTETCAGHTELPPVSFRFQFAEVVLNGGKKQGQHRHVARLK